MSLIGLSIVGVTLGISLLARDVPTEDYMLSTFQAGQSFYSEGAYDQAIEKYSDVGGVRSLLLDDAAIVVVVGDVEATVKDAAIYQVGNSYFKMFEEEFQAAEATANERQQEQRFKRANEYLEEAVSHFSRVEKQSGSEELRVLAMSRIMTSWYTARRYQEVIRVGREFVDRYPDSAYLVEALYNIGWSWYELGDHGRSIDAFTELTERFESGFHVSRALFQIGECWYDQGRYAEAIPWYQRLVDRADILELTEQEIQRMQFEKVAGLVDETEYELTAKAQIRIGDSYSRLGEFEQAEASYRVVISVFARERRLVERAYQSLADMHFENRRLEPCVAVYREAIDNIPNRIFKARMQFQLAKRYAEASREWGEDLFDDAVREYNVYLKGYAEVAQQAGFTPGNAWFEIGQARYAEAEGLAQAGEESREAYGRALEAYSAILDQYSDPSFLTAARFNAALCKQRMGGEAELAEAVAAFRGIIAEDPAGTYARSSRFQLARMYFGREEFDRSAGVYAEIIAEARDSTHLDIARFELGLVLQKGGDLEGAVEEFLAVRRSAPQFSLSRLEAGRAYVSLERYDSALGVLSAGMEAAGNDGERAQYHYLAGKAWAGRQDYEPAVEAFTRTIALTADPALVEIARYDRGTGYSRLERYAEAEKDLRVLVDSGNERIRGPAQKMLGLAYLRLDRQQEALASYGRLAETSADATERAEYMVLMLELFFELEQFDMAIATGRQILDQEFEDSLEHKEYWIDELVYYLIGESQYRSGQADAAMATYAEGLRRFPSSWYSPDMAYGLGTLYFEGDRLDDATRTLADFVKRFPRSPNALYGQYYLGYAHFNLREWDQSLEAFRGLVDRFPNAEVAAEALMRSAESAFNLGRFDEVAALYGRLLESYPESPFSDDAMYNLAWAHYEAKDEEAFIAGLERLLSTYPGSEFVADARFTLGDYYFNKEEYERAQSEYRIVLAEHGGSAIAREVPEVLRKVREIIAYNEYERAMAVFSEGLSLDKEARGDEAVRKFEEAAPLFTALMEKYPGTEVEVGALSNLGICYEFLRRWQEAVQAYDKVIALYEQEKASQEAFQFAKGHRDWIVTSRL